MSSRIKPIYDTMLLLHMRYRISIQKTNEKLEPIGEEQTTYVHQNQSYLNKFLLSVGINRYD